MEKREIIINDNIKDKVEIILRHFKSDVFDGMESELLFDEELFLKWLENHLYLIEDEKTKY